MIPTPITDNIATKTGNIPQGSPKNMCATKITNTVRHDMIAFTSARGINLTA